MAKKLSVHVKSQKQEIKESDNKKKKKLKFLKVIVVSCIVIIIIYTAIQVILSYKLGIELSPILTGCVYAFFGTELASCAYIKTHEEQDSSEEVSPDDTEAQG